MNEARAEGAAAYHKDLGFLVTGGKSSGDSFKTSTEITQDGVTFRAFTSLPIGVLNHCMVALDGDEEGDFFVGGGDSSVGKYTKKAFIHKDNQWMDAEQLPTGRRGKKPNLDLGDELFWKFFLAALICGPVRAGPGGRVEKIVAAGGWDDSRLDNLDIYDLATDTWVTGG